MAPTMNNLEKLVKQPYGCGEQNMISMVPNVSFDKQSQIKMITCTFYFNRFTWPNI